MFIGTVLKSLEIEDLVSSIQTSQHCYLARSFIRSSDANFSFDESEGQNFETNELGQSEGDDQFYEAPESLSDSFDQTTQSPLKTPKYLSFRASFPSENLSLRTPSFSRIAGLLPDDALNNMTENIELAETLDSFVKAQIVIYDQNSVLYNHIDKRVSLFLLLNSYSVCNTFILIVIL